MLGIAIKQGIGIGDGLQFSSVPENYYQETGQKLYDVNQPWFFDHNPYVVRQHPGKLDKVIQMWNFSPKQWDWPIPRLQGVYLNNAEIFAQVFGVKHSRLNRPRLYKFEEYPFELRTKILFQTHGKSHGEMPPHITEHILKKYKNMPLYHIGPGKETMNLPHIDTPTLWDLAEAVSQAKMIIGLDSGPLWMAACFPDVICKKVRTKPSVESFKYWVPLAIDNIHSHWDSREHMIYNTSEHDVGFTWSYRRI